MPAPRCCVSSGRIGACPQPERRAQCGALCVFAAAVLRLLMSPGPNMAFVLAHGVRHGWRGGTTPAGDIGTADVIRQLAVLGGAATRRPAQHAGASPWPSRLLALVLVLLALRLGVVTSA